MTDEVVVSAEQVSAPVPLVEAYEPAKPAPAAEEQKTDKPAASEETAKTEAEIQQAEQEKKLSRRERKVQRERDLRIAAETRLQMAEERLAKVETKPTSTEPKREDYADYEAFQDARQDWRADQREKQRDQKDSETQRTAKAAEVPTEIAKSWGEKEAKFIEKNPTYEKNVAQYVKSDIGELSNGARQLLVESDVGPALLNHLATDEEEHDRIAALSPARQIIELGKLEDKLPKAAEAKKSSDAPAPAKPNPQGKSSVSKDPDKMSMEDYMAYRKQGGARWAR